MKKQLLLILLTISLCVSCSKYPNVLQQDFLYVNNIKGKVKSIAAETFEAEMKLGEVEKGYKTYPTQDMSLYLSYLINSDSKFTLNEDGKVLSSETKYRGLTSSQIQEVSGEFSYDASGNIIKSVLHIDDVIIETFEIEGGRPVRSETVRQDFYRSKLRKVFEYEGDLLKEINIYVGDVDPSYKIKYQYENGITTSIMYNSQGKEDNRYAMDEKVRSTFIDHPSEWIINYEPGFALPSELRKPADASDQSSITTTFDETGNYATWTHKKVDGNTEELTFSYTYDSQGNWTERIAYKNEEPLFITYRTYEYY